MLWSYVTGERKELIKPLRSTYFHILRLTTYVLFYSNFGLRARRDWKMNS